MAREKRGSEGGDERAGASLSLAETALLVLAFSIAALVTYSPALEGPWISDDISVVRDNQHLHELSLDNARAWFDPGGMATARAANYAPVHLGLHAVAWSFFGLEGVVGHHALNVILHAINAVLVALAFLRAGIPRPAALLGAGLFLVHPTQVEAVAWISQLKTLAAFAFSLGALALWDRRPGIGAGLFGLAVLTKIAAVSFVPIAAARDWVLLGRVRLVWLGLWAAIAAACLVPELRVFSEQGLAAGDGADLGASVRNIVAIAPRYLVMAATATGLSTFHDPAPVTSWSDPWLLAGAVALGALAWVWISSLRARRPSAVWWTWAAAAYAPVSQVLPFANEMGDRYLYFVLPGLIGGVLLDVPVAARALAARLPRATAARLHSVGGARVAEPAVVAALVVLSALAWQSYERAGIWRSEATVVADSVKNYPDSVLAHVLRARNAARIADADVAVAELRIAIDRGYDRYQTVGPNGPFRDLRQDPRIRALQREMARAWIERLEGRADLSQIELYDLAGAYQASGDRDRAVAALERAALLGGPRDQDVRAALDALGRRP